MSTSAQAACTSYCAGFLSEVVLRAVHLVQTAHELQICFRSVPFALSSPQAQFLHHTCTMTMLAGNHVSVACVGERRMGPVHAEKVRKEIEREKDGLGDDGIREAGTGSRLNVLADAMTFARR